MSNQGNHAFLKSYRTINLYKATTYTAFTMRRMAKAGNGKSPGKKNGAKARHIWQKRCVPEEFLRCFRFGFTSISTGKIVEVNF